MLSCRTFLAPLQHPSSQRYEPEQVDHDEYDNSPLLNRKVLQYILSNVC